MVLGSTGKLTPDQARRLAKKMLGAVAQGADPAIEKAAEKQAETLQDLANLFLTEHVDPTRSRNLVTDALACQLALELSERQQTLRVSRSIEVVVLNCCVTATSDAMRGA